MIFNTKITYMESLKKKKIGIPCGWIPSLLASAGTATAKMNAAAIAQMKRARSVFLLILPQSLKAPLPKRLRRIVSIDDDLSD